MTNFYDLIADLNSAGLNDSEIARRVDSSQPNIRHLRTNKKAEPRYNLGVRVVKLHIKIMREQRAAA